MHYVATFAQYKATFCSFVGSFDEAADTDSEDDVELRPSVEQSEKRPRQVCCAPAAREPAHRGPLAVPR